MARSNLAIFPPYTNWSPLQLRVLLERSNKSTGGRIVTLAVSRLIQLLEDLLGQALAQLDTPLVKGVDVPNGALGKGEVLVVDNQSTELGGTNVAANQDAGGGTVAQEDLVLHQVLRSAFSLDLLCGLADHQSLGLCEVVGCQHLLVQVIGDGVV